MASNQREWQTAEHERPRAPHGAGLRAWGRGVCIDPHCPNPSHFGVKEPLVELKATDLDVYVDGVRVGHVIDCGDCWRGGLYGRRKRRLYNIDFDSQDEAVRGVVTAATT